MLERVGDSADAHPRRRVTSTPDLPPASWPLVAKVTADAARAASYRRARRRIRCTWIDAAGRCQTRAAAGTALCLLHTDPDPDGGAP